MATDPSHLWTSSTEPHALRRKHILKKHPEISKLWGNNPWTTVPIVLAVIIQTAAAAAVGIYDVPWWAVFVLAWTLGSIGAGNLMAAHHEVSHFLVFKEPLWNKALWIFGNAPLGIPLGTLFKQYHVDHHSEMGVNGVDTGIWTATEAWWVRRNWAVKLVFLVFFPIPFFFRPFFMFVNKKLEMTDLVSWIVIPAYDIALCYFAGQSLKPFAFLVMSLYHGVGLHPIAGHCISEHVMLNGDGQETHSCYDALLNPLLYNFGYHVEHHDFPNIPWNRLPQLRRIAPEYYDHLVSYNSWTWVMWKFITDPTVGSNGIMTKRPHRTGAGKGPPAGEKFVPSSSMPLLRGITASSL